MGNAQGVWILDIVLILDLIAEKQRMAAKRPGLEIGTAEGDQPRHSRNALILKKSKYVFVKWK